MLQLGGPLSPSVPTPDTSMQGVLSAGEGPGIAVCVFTFVFALIDELYKTFGNSGWVLSTVTSPEPETSTLRGSPSLFATENVMTHELPAVTVAPRQLKVTLGNSAVVTRTPESNVKLRVTGFPLLLKSIVTLYADGLVN